MSRNQLIVASFILFAMATCAPRLCQAQTKPNILVIMADDVGYSEEPRFTSRGAFQDFARTVDLLSPHAAFCYRSFRSAPPPSQRTSHGETA